MKLLKLTEIKDMSPGELVEQVNKSQIELVDLRMKLTSRQLEDSSSIKKKRKEIARMLTVQTQIQTQKSGESNLAESSSKLHEKHEDKHETKSKKEKPKVKTEKKIVSKAKSTKSNTKTKKGKR